MKLGELAVVMMTMTAVQAVAEEGEAVLAAGHQVESVGICMKCRMQKKIIIHT